MKPEAVYCLTLPMQTVRYNALTTKFWQSRIVRKNEIPEDVKEVVEISSSTLLLYTVRT